MFEPLKNKDYAALFSAQMIALLGTGLTTVALALLAFDLAGSDAGQVLGIALAIKMVAYVVLAPIMGGLAPMVPRKAYLILLDLMRALLVLCLPFVSQVWHVYGLIFLLQSCSAGFTPVYQATIPDVLEDEESYTKALSLSRLTYDMESLISPALAGAALLLVSFDALFAANALAFLISAWLVSRTNLAKTQAKPLQTSVKDRITFGIRAYLATPRLRGLLALSMAVAAGGAMVIVNTVVFVQGELKLAEEWTAVLLMAFGFGSMLAAISLPRLFSNMNDRSVSLGSGLAIGAALAVGALMPGFAGMAVLWAVVGAGYSAVLVSAGRLLNRSSNKEDRTAYFTAQFALSHGCFLVTYPLAGWLGGTVGLPLTFAVFSLLVLISVGVAVRVWPRSEGSVLEHEHKEMSHAHLHVHGPHHQHDHEGWEGPEPHSHPHYHPKVQHSHDFKIDLHHLTWPT